MARPPSTMDVPFHANVRLVAQRRRGLLRHPDKAPTEARRLSIRHRPSSRHQPLPRRAQSAVPALHLDSRSRQDHRRRATRAPSVKFDPLGVDKSAFFPPSFVSDWRLCGVPRARRGWRARRSPGRSAPIRVRSSPAGGCRGERHSDDCLWIAAFAAKAAGDCRLRSQGQGRVRDGHSRWLTRISTRRKSRNIVELSMSLSRWLSAWSSSS